MHDNQPRGKFGAAAWFACLAIVFALVLIFRAALSHQAWVTTLTKEGSPAPTLSAHSPSGYELGQRHFLGTHQRGETYRWIAEVQEAFAAGPWTSPVYAADTLPEGRPRLAPKLQVAWLALIAGGIHLLTGDSVGVAAEHAALWEPLISHVLALLAAVAFMAIRHGAPAAGATALFFALYPPVAAQFLPGVLSTLPWALVFAAGAIALHLPSDRKGPAAAGFSPLAAIVTALALWLDPAFGFPAVLIATAVGVSMIITRSAKPRFLHWAVVGAAATVLAWLVDQAPWNVAASELRYVHPLYAAAWLGAGLALAGWQHLRSTTGKRAMPLAGIGIGLFLFGWFTVTQLKQGFSGWLHTGAAMRRMTSLDESRLFDTVFSWMTQAPLTEVALVLLPLLLAAMLIVLSLWHPPRTTDAMPRSAIPVAIVISALVVLVCFKVRWMAAAALVALPIAWGLRHQVLPGLRRSLPIIAGVFAVALLIWNRALPESLRRPTESSPLRAADLEALVYRHLAHWMATHHPGHAVAALAPPELSDSLIFHGGGRALLSTAWESHRGHVAAARVLSAAESSEAEAVLDSLAVTHVVLTSWDPVFPLLVQESDKTGKDTLHARLQRWVLPRFLRAVPYHLPSVPGYGDQKLVVFAVTAPQDEALALSRLAEYFVEMNRPEPAALVAKTLADSFPDDPNAVIARALVYERAGNTLGFGDELTRIATDAADGKVPFAWDRRVQRAIALALGRRTDVARTEITACVAAASEEAILELTPLQAHRFRVLARRFEADFADPRLLQLLNARSAEYTSPAASRSAEK